MLKPRNDNWLHVALLMSATFLAYVKVLHAGFMNWDDMDYVFNIRDINSGISLEHIKHWFSRNYVGNYQPLPVFTYALDHLLGDSNPTVYHAHNLLWHMAATLLVYRFMTSLQSNKWIAFFVAMLFAVHPVQTESVSWIAARNKSMNAVFYFAALCFYIRYIKTAKKNALVWVTLFGLLAYLCKATALALPPALFSVDIWLRRPLNSRRIWLEKLPLVLAGIPVALVTLAAQKDVNFLQHHSSFGWNNIVFAGSAYIQYIGHQLFPVQLSVLYPYPEAVSFVHVLHLLLALGTGACIVIAYRKGCHIWCGGVLFFTVNLLPVLQLVQFGETLMADRYLYIACVGLWFPLVYQLFGVLKKSPPVLSIGISAAACILFLAMTFYRNDIWLNDINFWQPVVEKFPESAVAHYSLGTAYMKEGNLEIAEQHMNNAVRCEPRNYKAWRSKGALHLRQGKTRQALDALNKSLELYPYSNAYFTRAMIYHSLHKYALALNDITLMLEQEPTNARAYYIKADCEEKLGKPSEAMNDYNKAIALDQREPLFLIRRGLLHALGGNKTAAFSDLDKAVALNPANGEALYYRALIRYDIGQSPCGDLFLSAQSGYQPAGDILRKICK